MSDDKPTPDPSVDPYRTGITGRCPRCGRGRLFDGYLALRNSCSECGLDYGFADAGDGPAVFVIMLVGFLFTGLALWLEVSYGPPLLLHMVLWIPLTIGLCLWSLRVLKGLLINLQYSHDAHEGELDND